MLGNTEYDLLLMSLVIFVPSLFALVLMVVPYGGKDFVRWWSFGGTVLTFVLSLFVFIDYKHDVADFNLSTPEQSSLIARVDADARGTAPRSSNQDWIGRRPWIPAFNIDYFLGLDGISLPLVLLTTLLSALALAASWHIDKFLRGYCILFLILETGMLGTFLALDFFLFYIFWEVMLLPMYFLIGIWGGPRREYAAIKFFLYTLLGSVFILIALLGFYFTDVREFKPGADPQQPHNSFDIVVLSKAGKAAHEVLMSERRVHEAEAALQKAQAAGAAELKAAELALREAQADVKAALKKVPNRGDQFFYQPWFQLTMFLLLFIGFAIKLPMFPFHTWLPDAHVEAPTPISMILAGVLLKMGGYGILRIAYPICPYAAETLAWWVGLFGVINIVYGAFAAMAQTDFKKLVAYSSISHMGYVLLGIAVWPVTAATAQFWAWGVNGAMFQMIAHGITSAGMFFLVGVIYDRAHHRDLARFRGLYEPMPYYGGISAIIFFAAMGLPGLCGFVGEFMVILGTWNYSKLFAILAALTVVLTAAYILWTLQRVYLGTNPAYKDYTDMDWREIGIAIPLVVLSIALGIFPNQFLLSYMEPTVTTLVYTLAQLGR